MAPSHIIWNSQGMSSQGMSSQGMSNHLRTLLLLSASALISLLAVETVLGQSQKEKWDRAICDAKGVATCNLRQSEPAGFVFTDRMLFEILFDRPDAVPITNPRTLQDITGIKPNPLYLGYDLVSLSAAPYKPALPPKTVITWDGGGRIDLYWTRWQAVAGTDYEVEIIGQCFSACTMVTALIPKERLCFGPDASLGFHMARAGWNDPTPKPQGTQWMIDRYPVVIQDWIKAKGGLAKMPQLKEYWTLEAPQLWTMGYRRCQSND
jgi:hypothetical protein